MAIQTVTGETLAEFIDAKLTDPFAAAEKEAEKAEDRAKVIKAEEKAAEDKPEPKEEPAEEVESEEAKEDKPKKGKLATRFSELTGKARAAEERASAAEAKLAELEGKKAAAPATDKPAPDAKDFTDFDDYTDAVAEWKAEKKLAEREATDRKAKEEAKAGEAMKAWNTRLDAAKERYADFHEIVTSAATEYEPVIRKILIESEYGPDVLYHLSNDDADAAKFSKMNIDQQIKFIGRLEGRFEDAGEEEEEKPVKVEKPRVKLPTPITPIKSKNISNDPIRSPGEFTGTYAEYKAARLKDLR